ncbi:ABC transporter ATP-binding protein [Clavibacter michiganensis]|uniref:ABC transporter ATP-binding protein n=1 Tax=Clavibacter michiganensis TaxID=28447 RepID=UPI0026DAB918|nr:ABC transporter ATP-binding protein [Clavibacter michiganensis]MDO4025700.1 ABC transporter ATP-binding protein [Clavibacter michiganensis]MDO4035419.1 ABC transporter ATP-binding protein [Clavibacter michiganensis]MDO4047299.1 ABC transporter ATP-binding protein [Clavibacter michiganensis]MDO4074029.1 ABC transporter ATP-binding protein [Clavibacter michiganensis]MDO4107179.1 ABC transporter ATP-binding protein [Clavibacter michiganensis]
MSTARPETAAAPRARSRNPFARRDSADDGPRARFSELLPYILEQRGLMAFVVVLSVLGAAASLGQPLLVQRVVGVVQEGGQLGVLVWALVGLVVVSGVLSGYQHYLLQRMGEGVVLSSRRTLVRRILRLPISEFDTRRTGDLVSRVGSDTTLLRAVLTQGLVEAIGGAVTFLGAIIAMLIIDPVLLSLTVLVVAVSVVAVVGLSGRIRVASQRAQRKVGDLAASVERAIGAIRTVRASNATDREIRAIETDAEGAWEMGIKVAKASAVVVPIAGIAMQASFLVVVGVGGYRVAAGAITVGDLVAFILFLFLMIMPLGQAFGAVTAVNQALGALGRIQEIVKLPVETDGDADLAGRLRDGLPAADDRTDAPAVELVDVRFAYPVAAEADGAADADAAASEGSASPGDGDDAPGADRTGGGVLQGISFRAERGTRIALVGPSGAGKSTILALIERFYDPTSGVVRVGGRDIRTLDREDLRRQIGYVEQDAPVLAGTLRENLTLTAFDATDEDCIQVLHAVNLTEVLARNELGLDAPVGEDGIMLSGGERQRLAIARTLLSAPPILLLDESTSSLDGLNEQLLRKAIDAVAEHRTLIVIAHRLSTVVDSDLIVVVEKGRVVGTGTHAELVVSAPLYRDLAKHQLLV